MGVVAVQGASGHVHILLTYLCVTLSVRLRLRRCVVGLVNVKLSRIKVSRRIALFLLGAHVLRKGTSRSRQTHREAFERRPARRARDRHWLCEELIMDGPRAPAPPVHGRVQVSPEGLFYIGARPCCDRV